MHGSGNIKANANGRQQTSIKRPHITTRRRILKPIPNMASKLCILLSLALFACINASPVPETTEVTTTESDEVIPLVAVYEVIEVIPDEVAIETTTGLPEEATHKVAKRSVIRGDNANNDLLAELEGLNYENGLSSLDGRRIKFLPTWVGK